MAMARRKLLWGLRVYTTVLKEWRYANIFFNSLIVLCHKLTHVLLQVIQCEDVESGLLDVDPRPDNRSKNLSK